MLKEKGLGRRDVCETCQAFHYIATRQTRGEKSRGLPFTTNLVQAFLPTRNFVTGVVGAREQHILPCETHSRVCVCVCVISCINGK